MSTEWLPELLLFEDSGGNWSHYVEELHLRFSKDFVDSKPNWPGKRVGLKNHPEFDGKSATFWHMISEGSSEADRTPDIRRCERISWPRPIMDDFDAAGPGPTGCRVLWWTEPRRRETRYHLAPEDFSYVVVVADRGDFVLPWTAYFVEYEHRREKLKAKWRNFWSQKS